MVETLDARFRICICFSLTVLKEKGVRVWEGRVGGGQGGAGRPFLVLVRSGSHKHGDELKITCQ